MIQLFARHQRVVSTHELAARNDMAMCGCTQLFASPKGQPQPEEASAKSRENVDNPIMSNRSLTDRSSRFQNYKDANLYTQPNCQRSSLAEPSQNGSTKPATRGEGKPYPNLGRERPRTSMKHHSN